MTPLPSSTADRLRACPLGALGQHVRRVGPPAHRQPRRVRHARVEERPGACDGREAPHPRHLHPPTASPAPAVAAQLRHNGATPWQPHAHANTDNWAMGYLRHALRFVTGGLEPWRAGELPSLTKAPERYPWLQAFVDTLTGGKGPAGERGAAASVAVASLLSCCSLSRTPLFRGHDGSPTRGHPVRHGAARAPPRRRHAHDLLHRR